MLRSLILLALLLPLAACGHKGPVRPLAQPLPESPAPLTIRQTGDAFVLGWTIPTDNQDGSPLTDLAGFRIYRMTFEAGEDCSDCRDTSVLWREIDPDYPREARRIDSRLFLRDAEVRPGYGYRYRVVAVTGRGHEGASAVATRIFLPPPPPPRDLTASGHDRLVRLSWSAPDAEGIVGYQIYRRSEGEAFHPLPLTSASVTGLSHDDYGPENGQTYHYAVTAIRQDGETRTESSLSPAVEATPRAGF